MATFESPKRSSSASASADTGVAELAQVRYYLAETWFQLADYVQAASDFRKVADEFSMTDYAPLALLRAGDSNLRLWHRPELDPSYGETALAIYQELAGRFPDSEAAGRARPHVRRLENQFAEKTYKTGIFYMRRKAFDSAIIYFKDVIANYPTAQRAPDALLRLVDSYHLIGYKQGWKRPVSTCGASTRSVRKTLAPAPRSRRFNAHDVVDAVHSPTRVPGEALFGGSFDPVHVAHLIVAGGGGRAGKQRPLPPRARAGYRNVRARGSPRDARATGRDARAGGSGQSALSGGTDRVEPADSLLYRPDAAGPGGA